MGVDVPTELPVRIDLEGLADAHAVQWLLDFKWSQAVDRTVFDPNIPPDGASLPVFLSFPLTMHPA